MATFYFTYGQGDPEDTRQAYKGGWTEVEAETPGQAVAAYKIFHPLTENNLLPCCGVAMTREQMAEPYGYVSGGMLQEGNGGYFCHDRITIRREVV